MDQNNSNAQKGHHLLMFYGNSCPMTKKAEPIAESVEKKLQTTIRRLEVYENEENLRKYKEVGGIQLCGGVPFFFNTETGSSVCGVREEAVISAWATLTTTKRF